jgi:uncharacterized protein (DUF1697 family)
MSVRYVAFLRGINLGKRRVKNTQLSDVFEGLGFENVKVLIASGNVRFDADEKNEAKLTKTVEAGLEKALGFDVATMLRSADEVKAMLDLDPFKGIKVTKETRLYVTLLATRTTSTMKLPYETLGGELRILSRTDREVFSVLTLKNGARSVDAMTLIEKEYGKGATTRNWNTIQKAAAL